MNDSRQSGNSRASDALTPRNTVPPPEPSYRPDIDGLRAIAVAVVVAYHAFPKFLTGGFVGVDVFFVISGFLISGIVLRGLDKGSFSFVEFYARRIKRIFPALAIVLAACLVFGWFALLGDEYKRLAKHSIGGAAFFTNFIYLREASYFDVAPDLKPLLHLWSLSIEEQFYIAWPLLLFIAYRCGFNILTLTLGLLAASFFLNAWRVNGNPVGTFFLLQTRLWELALGGVLAFLSFRMHTEAIDAFLERAIFDRSRARHRIALRDLKAWTGLAFIIAAVLLINPTRAFPGWWALLPTTGAFLLISAGPDAWLNRKVLAHPAFVFVGLISYPLYLWHWPLLSFARIIESDTPSAGVRVAAVVMSIALAWLTYRLVEKPIRASRVFAVPATLVAAMAILGGAGYGVFRGDGKPERVQEFAQSYMAFQWPQSNNYNPACINDLLRNTNVNYCLRARPDAPASAAILGDSHANMYYIGLSERLQKAGQNLSNFGKGGCVPFYGITGQGGARGGGPGPQCEPIMNDVVNLVLGDRSIAKVILTSRDPFDGEQMSMEDMERTYLSIRDGTVPERKNFVHLYVPAMRDTVRKFLGAGKEVIFLLDIPLLDFDPQTCTRTRPLVLARTEIRPVCAMPRAQVDAKNRYYRETIRWALRDLPNVKILNPADVLCDDQWCWAMKDGRMLYRDREHYSEYGSRYVADRMNFD